ncbi:MAG: carbon storage regulator CsrA [Pseudomonadota bacterium]
MFFHFGETIIIGDSVNVTVLGIQGRQIRLGINAPREIEVHREEVYNKIQHQKITEPSD